MSLSMSVGKGSGYYRINKFLNLVFVHSIVNVANVRSPIMFV